MMDLGWVGSLLGKFLIFEIKLLYVKCHKRVCVCVCVYIYIYIGRERESVCVFK